MVKGNQRSEFTDDGISRQVKIVEKLSGVVQSTKKLIWVGGTIAEERDGSDVVQKKFFRLGEWRNGVGNLYYARDHLGNLREMTDNANVVRARYEYDPYGRRTKVSGNLEADWGFTGHYFHSPSGLHLAWFRAYDANLGRWISRDPIAEGGGLNVYAYANHDPVNYVDPDGRAPHTAVARGGYLLGAMLGDYLYDKYLDPYLDDYLAENVDPDVAANLQRLREAADMARMLKNPAKLAKMAVCKHHTIPRAIQKELPPPVRNHPDVRGRRGNPNLKEVPEDKHKKIHSSPPDDYYPGGDYNRRFDELIRQNGGYGNMTPQKINEIRDQVVREFGL